MPRHIAPVNTLPYGDGLEPDDARSQWIDAGLRALRRDGVEAVRVERLAVDLGKTKGSFYWHFADRKALLAALLEAWRGRATQAVIEDVEAAGGDARARLATLMATTLAADGRLERAMRDWARGDAAVAAAMAGIDDRRLRYVAELLVGAGVAPADAKLRARFAYQSLIGRFVMAADPPEQAATERTVAALVDLLTR